MGRSDRGSLLVPCLETDPETRVNLSHHDWSTDELIDSLVDSIASHEGVDPMKLDIELGTTLFEHVDPEALERLVTANEDVEIAFTVDDIGIRVSGAGELLVCHRTECTLTDRCNGI